MVDLIKPILSGLEGLKSSHPNVEIIYKDLGAKKIGERLDELNNLALTMGYQGSTALTIYDGSSPPINVATVAMMNEFGTSNTPARAFMRRSVTENLNEIQQTVAKNFALVVALRSTPIEAMWAIGRFIAEAMVEAIDTSPSWAIPNSAATIASKGFDHPLIDTRLMRNSITWAVRKGSPLGAVVAEGQVA